MRLQCYDIKSVSRDLLLRQNTRYLLWSSEDLVDLITFKSNAPSSFGSIIQMLFFQCVLMLCYTLCIQY